MQVVYARQAFPDSFTRALFLAGPTPRSSEVASWRPRALELLAERGYDGAVFVPEDADGQARFDYTDQIEWESEGLALADVIVFWIPRELDTLPGFTTNVEWGIWMRSGKCVLGAPSDAPKLRYLQHHAGALAIPQAESLEATLDEALALLGPGALRRGGERGVPLAIWRQPGFQRWLRAQQGAGQRRSSLSTAARACSTRGSCWFASFVRTRRPTTGSSTSCPGARRRPSTTTRARSRPPSCTRRPASRSLSNGSCDTARGSAWRR